MLSMSVPFYLLVASAELLRVYVIRHYAINQAYPSPCTEDLPLVSSYLTILQRNTSHRTENRET